MLAPTAVVCVLCDRTLRKGSKVRIVPADSRPGNPGPLQRMTCLPCARSTKAPAWMRRREEKR